mmetsp:Transcript_21003/g.32918  ORF Transcript_21003/g.32918 Transcript_21003/m.32918 type:complete len:311 (+) Transcript_21003:52-984(+)|eukprot:CAMPEP_0184299492 /NCGR_PEP_ID=MMETSP1049-20130417/10096_1 /TAXON_ID=77928 /ORGANISM="Proteomonas sulcata, Strain CCMP704" /LENGTH=310 /DNA_ID=CAMNT_0026609947 /DNA_START=48 /DNA_END=980 /DNA_ORIENTATION=+
MSEMLEELKRQLGNSQNFGLMLQIVQLIKLSRLRRPAEVLKFGPILLSKYKGRLGNGQWDIREQVFIAACEHHLFEIATGELEALETRFPKSTRVSCLQGMLLEAQSTSQALTPDQALEMSEEAIQKYDQVLEEEPCNVQARKRKVCALRSRGTPEGTNEAIKALNEYLGIYPTDVEAWKELADIYLENQQLENARKALEDVVMLQPISYVNHLKLAEVLYTLDDYALARKYYAQSLELNPEKNPRAAFGMVLCTTAIQAPKGKSAGKVDATNQGLYNLSRQLVLNSYEKLTPKDGGSGVAPLVNSWLRA